MNKALDVLQCGVITAVGLTVHQTCAAIRAGISAFQDVYFLSPPEEPIVGARIPTSERLKRSPTEWLINLGTRAIRECLQGHVPPERTALLVNLPEARRDHPAFSKATPEYLLSRIQESLGCRFAVSKCLQEGHAGVFQALELARKILRSGRAEFCCVGGIESLLNNSDMERLRKSYRLRRPDNSWGLVPGEGAAFLLIGLEGRTKMPLGRVRGIGISVEDDTILGPHFSQGRGLQRALSLALKDAAVEESTIAFRISDANGERYRALECVMAEARFYRSRREHFPCWYLVPSVGDVMAAAGSLALVVACMAMAKGYAPGSFAMCEGSSDEGLRGACLVEKPPGANRAVRTYRHEKRERAQWY